MKMLIASATLVVLSGMAAQAADLQQVFVPEVQDSASATAFYLSVHGGVAAAGTDDVNFELSGNTLAADVSTALGYRLGGAIGVELTPNLSVEGEVSYSTVSLDEADIVGLGTTPVDGDASTLSLLANAIFGTDLGGWTPYVGVGVGAVNVALDVPEDQFGPDALSDDEWAWGAQLFAGIDFALTDNFTLGGRYRYQYRGDVDFIDDNGDPVTLGALGAQSLELVGTFKF